jgi:large subunit ribosomal protein L22
MATRQREKSAKVANTRDRRPTAVAKYIRISPDKVAIVLDLIRDKDYNAACAILRNTNKSASLPILKVLNSAAANAENNLNIMKDNLFVAECYAMAGPTLKRMMPRARGRADRILKRTSHIRIILDEKADAVTPKRAAKKTDTKANETKKAEGTSMKTTPKSQDLSRSKKVTTTQPVPVTQAEKPLTTKTNGDKKPLGTKEVASKAGAKAGQAAKDAKTAKPKKEEGKK